MMKRLTGSPLWVTELSHLKPPFPRGLFPFVKLLLYNVPLGPEVSELLQGAK